MWVVWSSLLDALDCRGRRAEGGDSVHGVLECGVTNVLYAAENS